METVKRDPRGQGDQGELSAIVWCTEQGAAVLLPLGHCREYDLVADFGDGPNRVQVKTSSLFRKGRWEIAVATRGGNRSWSGLVKYLDPSNYDYLFVLVGDGRRWFIPAENVEATSGLRLGGPKYAQYEIEPGQPIRPRRSPLDSATPWRDSRAVKGVWL
jgi:hypothetical protein